MKGNCCDVGVICMAHTISEGTYQSRVAFVLVS